jgi:dsRNA-specific ribonuclease
MTAHREGLEQRLNYTFRDPTLLKVALTHASAGGADYERLEFLGDRVLGLVVADLLYTLYPDESEGDLSKRHTALVRAETLAGIAAGRFEVHYPKRFTRFLKFARLLPYRLYFALVRRITGQ